jgi:hypothetical protein
MRLSMLRAVFLELNGRQKLLKQVARLQLQNLQQLLQVEQLAHHQEGQENLEHLLLPIEELLLLPHPLKIHL